MSLRQTLPRSQRRQIRGAALERAGDCCDICGASSPDGAGLICRELWNYDDDRGIQRLCGVEIHCPDCNRVTHLGHTATRLGPQAVQRAKDWLEQVNGWSADEVEAYRLRAWARWAGRNRRRWT